jgi:hypothetical protein
MAATAAATDGLDRGVPGFVDLGADERHDAECRKRDPGQDNEHVGGAPVVLDHLPAGVFLAVVNGRVAGVIVANVVPTNVVTNIVVTNVVTNVVVTNVVVVIVTSPSKQTHGDSSFTSCGSYPQTTGTNEVQVQRASRKPTVAAAKRVGSSIIG